MHTFIVRMGERKILNSIIATVTRKWLLPFARTGDFGSGDRAIVCVTRWDSTRQRFRHRMVRVAVKGNEIHLVSNTVDRFVGTIE